MKQRYIIKKEWYVIWCILFLGWMQTGHFKVLVVSRYSGPAIVCFGKHSCLSNRRSQPATLSLNLCWKVWRNGLLVFVWITACVDQHSANFAVFYYTVISVLTRAKFRSSLLGKGKKKLGKFALSYLCFYEGCLELNNPSWTCIVHPSCSLSAPTKTTH